MRTAIEGDDARVVDHLHLNRHVVFGLDDLVVVVVGSGQHRRPGRSPQEAANVQGEIARRVRPSLTAGAPGGRGAASRSQLRYPAIPGSMTMDVRRLALTCDPVKPGFVVSLADILFRSGPAAVAVPCEVVLFAYSAASWAVKNSLLAMSRGRSNGVRLAFAPDALKSGWPSGVRGPSGRLRLGDCHRGDCHRGECHREG